ncbi:MAG: aminotransferase class III-fold pyridoxal phosphate-dependent enzyme, partial [Anaerolineae bacterium]|nr:aminotransferase class III-fold pyridoxal phosphate-dependent enzyme [Anaerolineae bacterium]
MKTRDRTRLLVELAEAYAQHAPQSAALNEQAKGRLLDGGSHALRLIEPFPPRIVAAQGGWLKDEDGHDILDFWQGHLANILGHNPEIVTSVLAQAFEERLGLQTGFPDRLQVECAEILCRQTGAERVRFTTSGSLATMYATLLSRAFTERDVVMKVGGGWHGAQPWGLKGVGFEAQAGIGFQHVDTEGLPSTLTDKVVVTGFNDPGLLRDHFRQYGDRLACFIVEPFIGAGGIIPATREYLQTARELAHQYGVVLIFDEVIAGF